MQKNKTIESILIFLKNYSSEEDEHGVIRAQLNNLLSQERKQWEDAQAEITSSIVNAALQVERKEVRKKIKKLKPDSLGMIHVWELSSLLESKKECDCHRHCENKKCGIKSFNHVTKPCEKYNAK